MKKYSPTKKDVDKLLSKFGVPKEGAVITHKQLEAALGKEKGSNRFVSVVYRWREQLLEKYNVRLISVYGTGLKAGSASERLTEGTRVANIGFKKVDRAKYLVATIQANKLTAAERKIRNDLHKKLVDAWSVYVRYQKAETTRTELRVN